MERRLDRLFRRFRARGDVAALGDLFDLAAPELARVALFLCRDPQSAEDAVQATFQTAIEKAGTHDGKGHVLPWMLGILANHARAGRERAARRPDPERAARRDVRDPADEVAEREFRELVEGGVSGLPDAYARAVRPYLEYGKSPSEIGRSLGISANAARVRLHRGLKLLRRALPAGAAPGLAPAGDGLDLQRIRGTLLDAVRRDPPSAVAAVGGSTAAPLGATLVSAWPVLAGTAALSIAATFLFTRALDRRQIAELERRLDAALARVERSGGERSARLPGVAEDAPGRPREARVESPGETREPLPEEALAERRGLAVADPGYWLERFNAATSTGEAIGIAREIHDLGADAALAVMEAIYHRIERVTFRQQVLKAFVFRRPAYVLAMLHLAATDPSAEVRGWAFGYLERYAFRDFSVAPGDYARWYGRFEGMPLGDVLRANAAELVERLRGLQGDALLYQLDLLDSGLDLRPADAHGVDLRSAFLEAGLVDLIRGWLAPGADPEVQRHAIYWMRSLQPDERLARELILPVVRSGDLYDSQVVSAAWTAIGREGDTWAVQPILDEMLNTVPRGQLSRPAGALARIGEPSVIPTLIAIIVADDTYDTVYGVGYFGLGKLTGVDYDESHDGAWWTAWWEANRQLFPAEVASLPVPVVSLPQ